MSWKAALVFDDERLDVEGSFDSEEEAEEAALYDLSCVHLGNSILEWNGDDYNDSEPDIEVWEEEEEE